MPTDNEIVIYGMGKIWRVPVGLGVDRECRQRVDHEVVDDHRIVADAYLRDRVQLTRFMLSAGVNARAERHDGATALDFAKSRRARLIKDSKKSKREQQDLSDLNKIIALLGRV